jgi:hypothetical protein
MNSSSQSEHVTGKSISQFSTHIIKQKRATEVLAPCRPGLKGFLV